MGAHLQGFPQIARGWFDAGNDKDSLAQVKEVPSHPQLVGSQAGGYFHAHTEVLVLKLYAPHSSRLGHLNCLGRWGQLDHLAEEHLYHVDNLDY